MDRFVRVMDVWDGPRVGIATYEGGLVHAEKMFDEVADEYGHAYALWRIDDDMRRLADEASARFDEYERRCDAGEPSVEELDVWLMAHDPVGRARDAEYYARLAALGEPAGFASAVVTHDEATRRIDVVWTPCERPAAATYHGAKQSHLEWRERGNRTLEVLAGAHTSSGVDVLVRAVCDPRATPKIRALASEVLAAATRAAAAIGGANPSARAAITSVLRSVDGQLDAAWAAAAPPGDPAALPPVLRDVWARLAALDPHVARAPFPELDRRPDGGSRLRWTLGFVELVPPSLDAVLREIEAEVGGARLDVHARHARSLSLDIATADPDPDAVSLRVLAALDRRQRLATVENRPFGDWPVLVAARDAE